ncbi:hypothetical protein [Brevundimonas sp. LPMIX5]|uniref:hypothetical protein n=1 Tax=Brevundimonas sp. LPMIX5 TaxID=2305887 RepID=UPI0011C3C592|nr:hypothetical protein [Brevundimonas sp. LPMIX5]
MGNVFLSPAALVVTLFVAGCHQSEPEKADAELAAITKSEQPASASAFYRAEPCDEVVASSPPIIGRIFKYAMADKDSNQPLMTRIQTVRSVSGDLVSYDEVLGMGEMSSPTEARQARFGLLLTASTGRSVRYEGAEAAIKALQPGQTARIPMTETLSPSDKMPAKGEAVVEFVGCGVTQPTVTGAPDEAVRVYRLTMPHSTAQTPGQMTEVTRLEILLSQRYGWSVVESVPSGTMVLTSVTS